ncbi:endostatin-like outer membrane protein, LenA/LenB family [Leptospira alexanderi]|uniref:PF07588 family protein n=1 Tax=Leptospira alexanderi serovar Manhao 3 str. L 60 TaxID=1049759 RepID=V6HZ98_9LEPT|nr:DUF1554 domain-containing protein [Leptospira alexanderi]EQA63270.1 PF07588 family protein [Leptospira alexanderi serovar Manhao 3 str. L 60]
MFQKMFLTLLTGSVVLTLYSCEDKKEDNMGTLFFLLSASGVLGSSQASTTPTSCKNEAFCRTFIATNNGAGYNGNLGGISGADAKCTAAKPSTLKGTYKAVIVATGVREVVSALDGSPSTRDWVLYPNKQYRRSDGTTVTFTTNANSMVTGNLENGIDSGAKKYFWTGFSHPDAGAFLWEAINTCNQWADANGGAMGTTGNTTSTNAHLTPEGAFTIDTQACNSNLNLLCVEQ